MGKNHLLREAQLKIWDCVEILGFTECNKLTSVLQKYKEDLILN